MSNITNPFSRSKNQPELYLAAFGKHPGWNDHLDDIGLETDLLIHLKRSLYSQGIGNTIGSGEWEKLDQEKRSSGFDHAFLWRFQDAFILGRIWASRDGKGRSNYPMILACQVNRAFTPEALPDILAQLDELKECCTKTSDAGEVIAAVHKAQDHLREKFSVHSDGQSAEQDTRIQIPDWSQESWQRLFHHLDSVAVPLLTKDNDSQSTHGASRHLRIPSPAISTAESLRTWETFFSCQLGDELPLMLFVPQNDPWLDILLGLPGDRDFFCLRANDAAIPPVTEIPYTCSEEMAARTNLLVTSFRTSESFSPSAFEEEKARSVFRKVKGLKLRDGQIRPRSMPAPSATGIKELLGSLNLLKLWRSDTEEAKSHRRLILLGTGVLLAACVLLSLLVSFSGDSRSDDYDSNVQPVTAENWRYLCTTYADWLGTFDEMVANAPPEHWKEDAYLVETLWQNWQRDREDLGAVDPRVLVDTTGNLAYLADQPPQHLARPENAERIARAADAVKRLEQAFADWPLPLQLQKKADELIALGWNAPAAQIKSQLEHPGMANSGTWIASVLNRQRESSVVLEQWEALRAVNDKLAATRDPVLTGAIPAIIHRASGAHSLTDLAETLKIERALLAPVVKVVEEDWPSTINKELFQKESSLANFSGEVTAATIDQWLKEVALYYPLENGSDPRKRLSESWLTRKKEFSKNCDYLASLHQESLADGFRARIAQFDERLIDLNNHLGIRREAATIEAAVVQLQLDWEKLHSELKEGIRAHIQAEQWLAERPVLEYDALATFWNNQRIATLGNLTAADLENDVETFLLIQKKLSDLEEFLVSLEKQIPAPVLGDGEISAALIPALESVLRTHWEEVLKTVEAHEESAVAIDFAKELATFAATATAFAVDLSQVNGDLERGFRIEDIMDTAGTPVFERLLTAPLIRNVELARFTSVPLGIADITQEADRTLLTAKATAADTALPLALASWRRLQSTSGEISPLQRVQQEIDIQVGLREKLKQAGWTEADQTRVMQELSTTGQSVWQEMVKKAAQLEGRERQEQMTEILARAERLVVDEKDLPPPLRLNLLLAKYSGTVKTVTEDADLVSLKEDFLRNVAEINPIGEEFGKFIQQISQLETITITPSFEEAGPAQMGWSVESISDDFGKVTFAWRDHEMTFYRVDAKDTVYMAESELAVGMAAEWLGSKGKDSMLRFLHNAWTGNPPGPMTWRVVNGDSFEPPKEWLSLERNLRPDEKSNLYTHPVTEPNAHSPLQYISGSVASWLAEQFGCILPTPDTWTEAFRTQTSSNLNTNPNLRGPEWESQRQAWRDSPSSRVKEAEKALVSSFAPDGPASATAVSESDGYLWFAPVNSSVPGFEHLTGNVAEWTIDEEGTYFIMGASALSHPSHAPDVPKPTEPNLPYSDVGLRLAFSAPPLTAGQEFKRLIVSKPYLNP